MRPPGARPAYSSTEFLEPFDWRNHRAFGFDMYSEPERRQAMDRAWKTGKASLSEKVQLVQETQEDLQRGVLIFLPIYTDQAQIPGATNLTLRGWAFSALRMKDVVNSALSGIINPDLAGTGVLVFDGTEPLGRNVLYDNLNLIGSDGLSHPSYEKLEIAGRTWLVGVQLASRQVGPNGIGNAFWITMLIGSTISMVAALISRILVSNHLTTRTALAVSEAAAKELSLSSTVFEESSQGILVTNPQGRILMANNAFYKQIWLQVCK